MQAFSILTTRLLEYHAIRSASVCKVVYYFESIKSYFETMKIFGLKNLEIITTRAISCFQGKLPHQMNISSFSAHRFYLCSVDVLGTLDIKTRFFLRVVTIFWAVFITPAKKASNFWHWQSFIDDGKVEERNVASMTTLYER